jgi:transcription elongation factor GreA
MNTNNNVSYLTDEGFKKLKEELEELKTVRRPAIANRIKEAKELGDLSENAEYADAREEQSFTEGRILELEAILKSAQVIGGRDPHPETVDVGDTVTVEKNGETVAYTIVGGSEADPGNGKISNESPFGAAFLGKKKGDEFTVATPKGPAQCKIIDMKR